MLNFILGHLGLFLGLGLVVVASAVLPGRLRWYVLSAGLAVIAFRAYQLFTADKRLKQADEERDRLRGTLEDLGGQREQLREEVQQLNQQLQDVKTQQNTLAKQSKALKASGDELATEKARIDKEAALAQQQDKALMQDLASRESALSLFNEAEQVYNELVRMGR